MPTLVAAPTPTAAPRPHLDAAVRAAVARHSGTIGVLVQDLRSGESYSMNADRRFTSASLYKLFVLEAAEAAIETGELDPDETLTVTQALVASDPYADLQAGTRLSASCALQTMVEMSGNSAADLLLARVGLANVTARMRSQGMARTAITADGAFTSPGDVGRLLEGIARGQVVSGAASQRMLDLLGAQQHNDRLPAPLPLDVRVAHKTGELPGLRHDAGIVFGPTGPYVIVAMVEDAPTESEARAAIVDVSSAVYESLEGAPATVMGLAPRLAEQVFRVPDQQGRLELLGDPRTETAQLPAEVQLAADADDSPRLRPESMSDLLALQHAAAQAGTQFWVRDAFDQPTDRDAAYSVPTEWILPCAVEQPDRVADRPVSMSDAAGAHARQAWLGSVVTVTDQRAGAPTAASDASTPVGRWLAQHAAEYGFAFALPESTPGRDLGHEPWTLRWLGRDMAARLRPLDAPDYSARALEQLRLTEANLRAQDPAAQSAPLWGLGGSCWTIATTSTRGCPSRWYFLGLPLS